MKRNLLTYLVLAVLVLGVTAESASAQGSDRRGTAGSTYLLVPTTARNAAMAAGATSGLSTMSGLEASQVNPANLMLNQGTNALFSRVEYVADIGVNTFGVAQAVGNNNIALTVTSWDFGDIPLQTEAQPEIDPDITFAPSFIQAGLTYARQFTDRIGAGVTAKLLSEEIDDVSATGIAFDAGMSYVVGETGLRFGVSLKNFGPQMAYQGDGLQRQVRIPGQRSDATTNAVVIESSDSELPSLLNFGVAYTADVAESVDLTVVGNFRSNSFEQDHFSGGLELGFREVLYVRGGYQFQEEMDQTMWDGWGFGAGLYLPFAGNRLAVDYAYQGVEFFDDVQMFTVSFTL